MRNTLPNSKIEPVDQSRSESAEEVNKAIGINWCLWHFSSLPGTLGQRDGASPLPLWGLLAKVEPFWQDIGEYLRSFLGGTFWHLQGNK